MDGIERIEFHVVSHLSVESSNREGAVAVAEDI